MNSLYTKQKMTQDESKYMGDLKLNEKQNTAFSYMVQGKNIFLTEAGGTGKSAIIKLFKVI